MILSFNNLPASLLKTNILYYTEYTLSNYWFLWPCYVITYVRWGIAFDELAASLHIRMGNRDNFGIFIHILSVKNRFVTHH